MNTLCQKCNSAHTIMVEYDLMHPDHYDGVSEILCFDCKARFGRWSGKELEEGEFEPVFGVSKKKK